MKKTLQRLPLLLTMCVILNPETSYLQSTPRTKWIAGAVCYSHKYTHMVELAKGATEEEARQKAEEACQMLQPEPEPRPRETIVVSKGCLGIVAHIPWGSSGWNDYLYESSDRRAMEADVKAWCETVVEFEQDTCAISEIVCVEKD